MSFLFTLTLCAQWTNGFGGGVELNSSNENEPVLLYNSDVSSPLTYGGGKLRVADDGTNAAFGNVVTFHGLKMRSPSDQILRLNFTRFGPFPEWENMSLIQGVENQTDEKFKIDTEGDAFFEGSLRLLDLGYAGSSSIAMRVRGDEAIFYNGTAFSWGFGGEYNRFADPMIFGSSGTPAPNVQVRIDQGALQMKGAEIFIDDLDKGQISFRSDDGSTTKSSIKSISNSMAFDDISNLSFSIAENEELGIRQGQIQLLGTLDVNHDSKINFHNDAFFNTPSSSIFLEQSGRLVIDNSQSGKEVLISSEGGNIEINNSVGANVNLKNERVGINEKNPEHSLHVAGNVAITGEFLVLSDRRLKMNILPINGVLENLLKLNPMTYNWIDRPNTELSVGLLAQEVEKIFPQLIHTSESDQKLVNYRALSVLAIQGLKEQQLKIDKLEQMLLDFIGK